MTCASLIPASQGFPYSKEGWAGVPFNFPNNKCCGREPQFPTEVFPWGSHNINRCQPTCPLKGLWKHRLKFHLGAELHPKISSNHSFPCHSVLLLPLPWVTSSPKRNIGDPPARNYPATGLSFIHPACLQWMASLSQEWVQWGRMWAIILYLLYWVLLLDVLPQLMPDQLHFPGYRVHTHGTRTRAEFLNNPPPRKTWLIFSRQSFVFFREILRGLNPPENERHWKHTCSMSILFVKAVRVIFS